MKKFLAMALAAVMVLALAACGSKNDTADDTGDAQDAQGGETQKLIVGFDNVIAIGLQMDEYRRFEGKSVAEIAQTLQKDPFDTLFDLLAAALALPLSGVLTYGKPQALTFTDVCAMAAAGFAIPWAFSGLYGLRMLEGGYLLVLTPLVAAFCSDALALFTGMALGRHKLAPLVSPHKTVEGAAGGLVGGMAGMAIFCLVYRAITGVNLGLPLCVALGLLGALLGELGDLSFSAVKRQYGIKDYGRLLPGHGGVLDRFDSVLFAAPVLCALLRALAA